MFTGIVQGHCEVKAVEVDAGITRLAIDLGELSAGLELGASVAIDGTCVTATAIQGTRATFELIKETTELSNLGEVTPGNHVNVERSFKVGDEIGGHILSGHIAGTVEVMRIDESQGHKRVRFRAPSAWMDYLMDKGFVALNGASLTIAAIDRPNREFDVSLIPETLARTGFRHVKVGDRVNLEVDSGTQAVVDTVRGMLRDKELLAQLR
ncbi:MAG: riboflavin synthase subunit alpha [Gammaproteobacteria bacterium]|nr:riboflavin synthase subunit alpha [Gammaproteobacteria bacterium]